MPIPFTRGEEGGLKKWKTTAILHRARLLFLMDGSMVLCLRASSFMGQIIPLPLLLFWKWFQFSKFPCFYFRLDLCPTYFYSLLDLYPWDLEMNNIKETNTTAWKCSSDGIVAYFGNYKKNVKSLGIIVPCSCFCVFNLPSLGYVVILSYVFSRCNSKVAPKIF